MEEGKQLGFIMPEEQFEKFEAEAKKVGMTKASLLKMFISEWLHRRGVK